LGRPKAAKAAQPTEVNRPGRPVLSGAAEHVRVVVTTAMTGAGGGGEPGIEAGCCGRGEHQRRRGNSPGKVGGEGAHPKDGSSTRRRGRPVVAVFLDVAVHRALGGDSRVILQLHERRTTVRGKGTRRGDGRRCAHHEGAVTLLA
jgi:hypothetical protein